MTDEPNRPRSGRVSAPHLAVGTEIGAYRVEAFLDRGGMASVYEATDLRLNRQVALKVLARELTESADFRERFMRESRFAASLDHPNIVPIYEAGEADGLLYIAMRYVRGGNLSELLRRSGPLDSIRAMAILHPVADALDTAHAAGLVHRDVKPANILLAAPTGRDGHEHVYLTDFGLTKRTSALTKLTATGNFIGTMAYISPEQIRGEPLDARTDMYAFGCVAYECLTGVPPFVKDDQAALLWAHLSDLPRPISDYRPELAAADSIVMRALAKKPNDRYQVCEDFVEALSEAVLTARHRKSSLTTAESALVGSLSDGPDHPTGPAPALPSGAADVDAADSAMSEPEPVPVWAADAAIDGPGPTIAYRPPTAPHSAAEAAAPGATGSQPSAPYASGPYLSDQTSSGQSSSGPSSPGHSMGGQGPTGPNGSGGDPSGQHAVPAGPPPDDHPAQVNGPGPAGPPPAASLPPPPGRPVARSGSKSGRRALIAVAAVVAVLAASAIVVLALRPPTQLESGQATAAAAATSAGPATTEAQGTAPETAPTSAAAPTEQASIPPASPSIEPPATSPAVVTQAAVAIPTIEGAPIPVGPTPGFMAIAPGGRYAYIANRGAGVVTVLDLTINKVIATIAIPAGPPQFIAFTPDGDHAYVSVYNDPKTINLVAVLDTRTTKLLQTIPVQQKPYALAVTPDGRYVYVPSHDAGAIDVIDVATNTVVQSVGVMHNPHWVTFTADGKLAYIANHESNVLSVMDTASRTVIKTIPVGTSPHSVAISPDGTQVAVVCFDSDNAYFVDTATNEVVGTVPVGTNPQDITYSADGHYAYTANVESDNVSVIDTATLTVTATIPTDSPSSVSVSPDGSLAYVTNLDAGTVTVLKTAR